MLYAVTAPGFSCVYSNWHMVERVRVFYPYLKWKKVYTQEQAQQFIERNKCIPKANLVYNYGDTFKNMYVTATYDILDSSVKYVIDTQNIGKIHVNKTNFVVEYKARAIHAVLPNIYLSTESISSHMSAIYNLLILLGEYVDVNLVVPNYSILYALAFYNAGYHRQVCFVQNYVRSRFAKVGFTLKRGGNDFE